MTKLSLCLYINKYWAFPNNGFLHCLLFFLVCGTLFMVCSQISQMTNILDNIPCLVSSWGVTDINYLQVSLINITKFAIHHNKNTMLETSWAAHESWFRRSKIHEVVQFSFEDVALHSYQSLLTFTQHGASWSKNTWMLVFNAETKTHILYVRKFKHLFLEVLNMAARNTREEKKKQEEKSRTKWHPSI